MTTSDGEPEPGAGRRIASFHLLRESRWRSPLALGRLGTDRLRLPRVPGLVFWRLLGTGRGDDTSMSVDSRRTAMFAVWDDDAALDRFLESPAVVRRMTTADETWHVRLRGVGGHGSWRGVDVLAGLRAGASDGPLAVITHADVRLGSWRSFGRAGGPVGDEVRRSPGLLAVVGIGEAPVGRLGTFSLWRDLESMRAFATSMPQHRGVVQRTRAERWYREELFARFEPYGSSGSWAGRDPLASA